eukprot:scaffold9607_cov85-Skeletonema_dohrnii-CCMP3373.AAC.1
MEVQRSTVEFHVSLLSDAHLRISHLARWAGQGAIMPLHWPLDDSLLPHHGAPPSLVINAGVVAMVSSLGR